MKKTVHIVVKDGLVQDVFADLDLDVDVVLYDLDTDDTQERAKLYADVEALHLVAKHIY